MLIKLNGLPWDKVMTPDITHHSLSDSLHNVVVNASDISSFSYLDQSVYYVMHQTPVTDELYKISCWSVSQFADYGKQGFHVVRDVVRFGLGL